MTEREIVLWSEPQPEQLTLDDETQTWQEWFQDTLNPALNPQMRKEPRDFGRPLHDRPAQPHPRPREAAEQVEAENVRGSAEPRPVEAPGPDEG